MSNFEDKDLDDLDFVRKTRRRFISGLLGDEGMPSQDNNDTFLRALKDTEAVVLAKARLTAGETELDTQQEQTALLTALLLKISKEDHPDDVINVVGVSVTETPSLSKSDESTDIVAGECTDSTMEVRDLLPPGQHAIPDRET